MTITMEDCIGLCGLSEAEVRAIAQHEHLPELVAAELGAYLEKSEGGQVEIRSMIEDDLRAAQARGEAARVLALKVCLHKFICEHPCCDRRRRSLPCDCERRAPPA